MNKSPIDRSRRHSSQRNYIWLYTDSDHHDIEIRAMIHYLYF